jgi:hypothetical protein
VYTAAASAILAIAGYALSTTQPPPPQPQRPSADISAFKNSLNEQMEISFGNGWGNGVAPCQNVQRFNSDLAMLIEGDEVHDQTWYFNGGDGTFHATAQMGCYRWVQPERCDSYASDGYQGVADENTHYPGAFFTVFSWAKS